MQGPLFDPDDQETFMKPRTCAAIPNPVAFDAFIESLHGINFVTLSACVKAIEHLFVNSRLKFVRLKKVDAHPSCLCRRSFLFDIDTTRFPLLHSFVNGYCKPHTKDFHSDSAIGYYKLQRNKQAIQTTVFAYWFLKPILSKDIARIICQQVLYAPRDTPCKEELFIAALWQEHASVNVAKLKTHLANARLEYFKITRSEEQIQQQKTDLQKQIEAHEKQLDWCDKVVEFAMKVSNKKQKR